MYDLKNLKSEVRTLNQEERKSLVNKIRKNIPFIYSDVEVCKFLDLPLPLNYYYSDDTHIYFRRGWTLAFNKSEGSWKLYKPNTGHIGRYNPTENPSHPIPTERDYE